MQLFIHVAIFGKVIGIDRLHFSTNRGNQLERIAVVRITRARGLKNGTPELVYGGTFRLDRLVHAHLTDVSQEPYNSDQGAAHQT